MEVVLMPSPSEDGAHRWGAAQGATFGVEQIHGCVLVRAAGEIDLLTSPHLRDAVRVAAEFSARIIVDLTLVTLLDSTGLSVLVDVQSQERARDGVVALVGLQPQVRTVFKVTRLDQTFPIFEELPEAVATLAQPDPGAA